jgi:hypothetical protein
MGPSEQEEIIDWFSYHAPTEAQRVKLETAREQFRDLALWLSDNVKNSRERSVAFTELRKAAMVVNQAIIFDRP